MPAKATKRSHAAPHEELGSSSLQRPKAARKQSTTRAIDSELELQLATVANALGKVPDLPPFVSWMLGRMMPKSLGESEDGRHRHQRRVVDMASLSLKKAEAALQQDAGDARRSVDAATLEHESLQGQVATAEASLAEKQDAHVTTMAKNGEDSGSLNRKATKLEGAKEDMRKEELRLREGLRSKSLLSSALEFAVTPWKAGTLATSSASEWSEQMSVIQERLKSDESLSVVVAAKAVLAKGADGARTGFDSLVMDALEDCIGRELQSIDSDMRSAEIASEERDAAVKSAEAECEESREVLRASSELASASQASVQAGTDNLAAAQQVVKNSSSDLSLKSVSLKVAEGSLDVFLRGPRHAFDELQKRAVRENA